MLSKNIIKLTHPCVLHAACTHTYTLTHLYGIDVPTYICFHLLISIIIALHVHTHGCTNTNMEYRYHGFLCCHYSPVKQKSKKKQNKRKNLQKKSTCSKPLTIKFIMLTYYHNINKYFWHLHLVCWRLKCDNNNNERQALSTVARQEARAKQLIAKNCSVKEKRDSCTW